MVYEPLIDRQMGQMFQDSMNFPIDDVETYIHCFAGETRVWVEGFTDEMSEWMAAADVLVHSTGGLTVLEALMRGCPTISYGWGRGHLRVNNRAFVEFGLAEVVERQSELRGALEHALRRGRAPAQSFDNLPSAASFVLEEAHAA